MPRSGCLLATDFYPDKCLCTLVVFSKKLFLPSTFLRVVYARIVHAWLYFCKYFQTDRFCAEFPKNVFTDADTTLLSDGN